VRVAIFSRYPRDVNQPRGGVESVTVSLVRSLARLDGLDIHVVTLEKDLADVLVERHDGAAVHRLPASRWPQMLDILGGPGRRRLVDYILDLHPDVVHAHETHGLMLGGLPLPFVFTVHGFDHANLEAEGDLAARVRSPLWRMVEKYGLSHQHSIISITPYVRRMIEPLTGARIHDIDNPVDYRFFETSRDEQPGRVFFAGWITERKNPLGVLEAFARVRRRGIEATVAIAGEAREQEYRDRLLACIEREKLADRVEFLGHVRHDRLPAELARSALFVLPSRQENSPMAIAEAMAVGVPVIASNRCGMPFMIREGESGYLIEPDDHDEIADRMARILTDCALRARMGQVGRSIAMERFHPDTVARKTVEVYRTLIDSGKGGVRSRVEGAN